jgi:hypothetical protein
MTDAREPSPLPIGTASIWATRFGEDAELAGLPSGRAG